MLFKKSSWYLKYDTTRLHYKNYLINNVYGNNRCLFYETRKYTVDKIQSY
jgi:hypothetical protein